MSYYERRRFLWILFLTGLLTLALTAVVSNATTLVRMEFSDLARQSTAIARLRCIGSVSIWDQGELWTETRFTVVEVHKGLLSGLVTTRMPGGSDGHVRSHVESVPEFRAGEEAYLFLWNRNGEPYRVLGWSQGTFRIAKNPVTAMESVTQDSSTEAVFDPQTREFRHGGIVNLPVAVFQSKLQRALAEEK